MAVVNERVDIPALGGAIVTAINANGNANLVRAVLDSDGSTVTVDKRRFEQAPLIKEADPEFERLLQEEEQIERQGRMTGDAYSGGYEAACKDVEFRVAGFLNYLFSESQLTPVQAFAIAKKAMEIVP